MKQIEVLICTCGDDGLRRVGRMELPCMADVRYLVSWQCGDSEAPRKIPESLSGRDDLRILPHDGIGLCENRNFAFDNATGDILLVADDDLSYSHDNLAMLSGVFEDNPDMDVALFSCEGMAHKKYPSVEFDFKRRPRGYYVTSFEMALRRESIAGAGVRFDEYFGINAPVLIAGEEEIFLRDCMRAGLCCRYFPRVVATHRGDATTSLRERHNPRFVMTVGAVIAGCHPLSFPFRFIIEAQRRRAMAGSLGYMAAFKALWKGAFYYFRHHD